MAQRSENWSAVRVGKDLESHQAPPQPVATVGTKPLVPGFAAPPGPSAPRLRVQQCYCITAPSEQKLLRANLTLPYCNVRSTQVAEQTQQPPSKPDSHCVYEQGYLRLHCEASAGSLQFVLSSLRAKPPQIAAAEGRCQALRKVSPFAAPFAQHGEPHVGHSRRVWGKAECWKPPVLGQS